MSKTIGEKIKELRKQKKMTQKLLSQRADIPEISIRQYENGNRNPKIEQIIKIATALSVKISDLFPPIGENDKEIDKYHHLRNQAFIMDTLKDTATIIDSFNDNPENWQEFAPLPGKIMAKQFKDIMLSIGFVGAITMIDSDILEMLKSDEFKSFIKLLMLKYDKNLKDSDK